MPVINHGTITGGIFYSSVSNESEGTIENGTFRSTVTNNGGTIENGTFRSTVTNNGGTINGGTFKDELTGSGIEPGYTLTAENAVRFFFCFGQWVSQFMLCHPESGIRFC